MIGLSDLLSLLKWRLALAIAVAAAAGCLLHPSPSLARALLVTAGMLILAAGAGCLNNWQDRRADQALERTRDRPLPAGRVSPGVALGLACSLMAGGLGLLALGPFPGSVTVTAAAAAFCYNGLYTPLKYRTLFSIVPGIICGALPVMTGWLAAGGGWMSLPVWSLMVVFGLWQPPHFWLIVLRYQRDYRPDGLPSMFAIFSPGQVVRILFVWVVALSMAILALPLADRVFSAVTTAALVLDAALLTALFAYHLFGRARGPDSRLLFAWLNVAVFLASALAIADR